MKGEDAYKGFVTPWLSSSSPGSQKQREQCPQIIIKMIMNRKINDYLNEQENKLTICRIRTSLSSPVTCNPQKPSECLWCRLGWNMETHTSVIANSIWGLTDLRLSCLLDGPFTLKLSEWCSQQICLWGGSRGNAWGHLKLNPLQLTHERCWWLPDGALSSSHWPDVWVCPAELFCMLNWGTMEIASRLTKGLPLT